MIKINIDSQNHCNVNQCGTVQEILENVRVLDTAREKILSNIKEQILEESKKEYPNISEKMQKKCIQEAIDEMLEDIIVVSRSVENEQTGD